MDALSLLRTLGALGVVLGLLSGALWAVRRYDIRLPGRVGHGQRRRLEMVERLSIDAKRSVALIRRDDREHLVLITPDGNITIETGIAPAAPGAPAAPVSVPTRTTGTLPSGSRAVTPPAAPNDNLAELRQGFGALVEQARARLVQAHG